MCGFFRVLSLQTRMGGVKDGNLGSRGKVPGRICKSLYPDSLFQIDDVAPTEVEAHLECHPWGWYPLCTYGGGNQERLSPSTFGGWK